MMEYFSDGCAGQYKNYKIFSVVFNTKTTIFLNLPYISFDIL